MTNNTYFEELERIGAEWTKAHDAHKEKKQHIIGTYGWDSRELKIWYEEEESMKFPYSAGACKAYRAWKYTEGDEIFFDDFVWEAEAHDFIDTLRKAGLKSFVIINTSTALMENLHWFAAEGCTMQGLCTITKKENRFGEEKEEQIMGIRFSLN